MERFKVSTAKGRVIGTFDEETEAHARDSALSREERQPRSRRAKAPDIDPETFVVEKLPSYRAEAELALSGALEFFAGVVRAGGMATPEAVAPLKDALALLDRLFAEEKSAAERHLPPDQYNPLEGVEELRACSGTADYTQESAWEEFSAEEILRIRRAIVACGWDIFADQLHADEIRHAAVFGKLSAAAQARLDRELR